MPKFTAVMGKSKTNRIMSIDAPTEDRARYLIHQQLGTNSQRREIRDQWVADGEHISQEFDEALANALIRGRLAELLAELEEWKPMFRADFSNVANPPAVVAAYYRARAALKAFDQGVVA